MCKKLFKPFKNHSKGNKKQYNIDTERLDKYRMEMLTMRYTSLYKQERGSSNMNRYIYEWVSVRRYKWYL